MTDIPKITIPLGMKLVEDGKGGYEIVSLMEPMSETVAFRVMPSTKTVLLGFVETFPTRQWGEAFRWLFAQDAVRGLMAERIAGATRKAVPK